MRTDDRVTRTGAWICFAAVVLLATAAVFSSKSHQTEHDEKGQANRKTTRNYKGDQEPWAKFVPVSPTDTFTLLLVVLGCAQVTIMGIQAWLFVRQLRKMDQSLGPAIAAAKAADLSSRTAEETLREIERPYLFVFNVSPYQGDPEMFITYSVANYGRLPAILEKMNIGFVFDADTIPVEIDEHESLASASILAPSERRDGLKLYLPADLSKGGGVAAFLTPTGRLTRPVTLTINVPQGIEFFFKALIRYRGPFTGGHETASLWAHFADAEQMVPRGGKEYNYVR